MPNLIKTQERAVRYVPTDHIHPNPWNRTVFDPAALDELAKSIKAEGIREPLILRILGKDRYEIASGNRRWLAAQKVGLKEAPCLVETLSDEQVAEDNIVMNIQREDIPPLELARMVKAYMATFKKKQVDAARSFGKSKAWVSMLLSYLDMASPEAIKKFSTLNLGWHQLQAIRSLGTDLATIIGTELSDGSLTPRRIIKRCNQLLYGRHTTKGGFAPGVPPPPDPLKKKWENVRSEVLKSSQVWWELGYGRRKLPNGQQLPGWTFFAAPLQGSPQTELAEWFTLMGKALGGEKIADSSLKELAALNQAENAVFASFEPRLPKNAAERAELTKISAKQGPKAVYAWIYGANSPITLGVPSSWKELGTTAEKGLKQILNGLQSVQ